jgi:SAM-dependent methyltransferase
MSRRSSANRATSETNTTNIPLPPLEMRQLVVLTELTYYENPSGDPVYPLIDTSRYESVCDFGCGCGRVARQLIQQSPQPRRYLGIDIHAEMIRWCQRALTPVAPQFHFLHHDVENIG